MSLHCEYPYMIRIHNLQKVLNGHTVIDIPDLQVEAGEIAALIGPVGSGKEILLALLTGQERPSMGDVLLLGLSPHKDRQTINQQIGVLFEDDGIYLNQTVESNLTFYGKLWGVSKNRSIETLTKVGLADQTKVKANKLASGLKRRLAFGRAILHQPKIILLYEPFARCDDGSISLLSDLIREMADSGAAVLILANESAYLTALCDTIHTLESGRVVESYKPKEAERAALPFKVPVRLEGRVALVNPVDILYADVDAGRAILQTRDSRLPTQFSLGELEERLLRSGFFRAHRAYLVNLQHVKEVITYTRNSFSLRLNDPANTEIPLSKSAAGELRELLDY